MTANVVTTMRRTTRQELRFTLSPWRRVGRMTSIVVFERVVTHV